MRRVVTGLNEDGKSCVLIDEEFELQKQPSGNDRAVIWACEHKEFAGRVDEIGDNAALSGEAPIGGSQYAVIRWPRHQEYLDMLPGRGLRNFGPNGEHVTRTIDYIYILDGEMWLDLEAESVLLRPHDFVVQTATRHAWRSPEGATTLGCMVNLRASEDD